MVDPDLNAVGASSSSVSFDVDGAHSGGGRTARCHEGNGSVVGLAPDPNAPTASERRAKLPLEEG